MDFRAFLRVIDFFVPMEVLSAVFLIFALENVIDIVVSIHLPEASPLGVWVAIYLIGVLVMGLANYYSADEEELEELGDDLEEL